MKKAFLNGIHHIVCFRLLFITETVWTIFVAFFYSKTTTKQHLKGSIYSYFVLLSSYGSTCHMAPNMKESQVRWNTAYHWTIHFWVFGHRILWLLSHLIMSPKEAFSETRFPSGLPFLFKCKLFTHGTFSPAWWETWAIFQPLIWCRCGPFYVLAAINFSNDARIWVIISSCDTTPDSFIWNWVK